MAAVEGQRPNLTWLFFGWSGRLSRAPFALGWAFWLMLLSAALARIMIVPKEDPAFLFWGFVFFGVALVSTVSTIMMTIKRLHDMNLPLALIICLFIPAISFFALIAFMVWPGTPGPNDYGRLPDRPKD
ncbi:DUF805 domain-containing protein [Shinella zoogloeoides]|uniref:DUF805 domain-containing protein n=1 Tax=Shinella zoogloeoides TaxID=352475 RepID=A0A6N8TD61_SHIZO|nr:DUF805 domain-containing protein [Shinella zoogloeoides]MXO01207.1 DUF805 domain-containing protein [Shinella zoogloeoides]UEX81792.1 DUF805 domain-containing protein [Shinella zoogloeoides]